MRNFLSVGETPVEIIFPSQNGITLIQGHNLDVSAKSSNGAGKSTIIEGILFALYGKTLRKIKKEEYYINEKATNDCVVELEFDNVKIIRRFTLTKKGKKGESEVEFFVDGVLQSTKASTTKVKEDIQNHIRVSFETMCNILIFGQHNMVSFLEASEGDKREIIESLMNLKEYNSFEEKAKKEYRETETKLKVLEGTFSQAMTHLGEQIALRHEQEKKHTAYLADLDREIAAIQARLDAIPNTEFIKAEWERYNASEQKKQFLKDSLTDLTNRKATLVDAQQEELKKKQPLVDYYNNLQSKQQVLDERLKQRNNDETVELYRKAEDLWSDKSVVASKFNQQIDAILPSENWDALISTAAKQLSESEKALAGLRAKKLVHDATCPECFGKIDINNCENVIKRRVEDVESRKAEQQRLIDAKKADLQRVADKKETLTKQRDAAVKEISQQWSAVRAEITAIEESIQKDYHAACDKLRDLLFAARSDVESFDKSLDEKFGEKIKVLTDEIGKLNRELFQIQKAVKPSITLEELATIQANAENDRKALREKKAARKINPFAEIIESLSNNIAELDKKVKSAEKAVKECEQMLPYLDFWKTAFGKEGIKAYVIDQIIPLLNKQIEYWLQIIYQGAISVTFDKFLNVVMVNNASKNEMIFGQGSGGERRRIDIAIMLAFRQIMKLSTGHDPNIVFFDEVGENLDDDGIMRLYDTLEDIAKNNRVYVITHNPVLLGLLGGAEKITVQKKGGVMSLLN